MVRLSTTSSLWVSKPAGGGGAHDGVGRCSSIKGAVAAVIGRGMGSLGLEEDPSRRSAGERNGEGSGREGVRGRGVGEEGRLR